MGLLIILLSLGSMGFEIRFWVAACCVLEVIGLTLEKGEVIPDLFEIELIELVRSASIFEDKGFC